jgi:hypothetical protein
MIDIYLIKLFRTSILFLLLIYSPIIFLSKRGFSFRNVAISTGFNGDDNRPCSCKNSIPFFGFVLNFSVPEVSN